PGERVDGVAVFERPTFKEADERLLLQVSQAQDGQGTGDLPTSIARAGAQTNVGSAVISRAIAAYRNDRREFHGGEAEELRRALGHKRSEQRGGSKPSSALG